MGKNKKEQYRDKEEIESAEDRENGNETAVDDQEQVKDRESAGKKDKASRKYDELYEKYIRLYSEFDNYRRRTQKELLDTRERGQSEMILVILPVLDDFERAMQVLKEGGNDKDSLEGIELIYTKLKKSLEEKGLKEMKSIGQDFDPDYHEAMTKIPAPDKDMKGKVVDEIQKGYLLKEKIVRHAKVVVGE